MTVNAWSRAPEPEAPPILLRTCGLAPGCGHPTCLVGRAGALTICDLAGVDFDALPGVAQQHYEAIALEAMTVMWDTAVEVGMTAEVTVIADHEREEHVDDAPG